MRSATSVGDDVFLVATLRFTSTLTGLQFTSTLAGLQLTSTLTGLKFTSTLTGLQLTSTLTSLQLTSTLSCPLSSTLCQCYVWLNNTFHRCLLKGLTDILMWLIAKANQLTVNLNVLRDMCFGHTAILTSLCVHLLDNVFSLGFLWLMKPA